MSASFALLLAFGGLASIWMINRADREMRADLLLQAQLLARTIDLERIQALSGSEADLALPDYQRLKEQLTLVRAAYPRCRFAYLIGRRPDGKVFFYVDSEPAGSADYSPPGQVYAEVPEGYRRVFDSRVAAVEGPVSDRWGTWVSALAPLTSPHPGVVTAVLGVDINARTWHWQLFLAALPVGLLVLALGVILALGIAKFAQQPVADRLRTPRMRVEQVLTCAVGVCLTLHVAWITHQQETKVRRDMFMQLAASRSEAFAERLRDLGSSGLESLAQFFENNQDVSPRAFENFTKHLAGSLAVQAWEWIPAVPAANKAAFESESRQAGFPGFEVWQRDSAGARQPAQGRAVYFPIFLVAPGRGNELVQGFDLGSEPVRSTALDTAIRTRLATTTEPIALIQKSGRRDGLLICRPVFTGGASGKLRGVVLAVVRMEPLIRHQNADQAAVLSVSLLRPGGPPDLLAATTASGRVATGSLSTMQPVLAFGRVFAVNAEPGPAFMPPGRGAWLILGIGLVLTVTATLFGGVMLRRREELERLVAIRTSDLQKSEQSYRNQFANNSSVMLLIDPANGSILDANGAAVQFYGYPRERLLGRPITDINTRPAATVEQSMAAVSPVQGARFEFSHRLADGTIREVEVSSSQIQFGGRPVLHSIINDITERRRALAALRESETFQRILLANLPVGVVIVDPGTRVIERVNAHASALFGAPEDQLVGKQCHALLCPAEQGACPVCDLGKVVDNSDREMLRVDGSRLPILKTVKRLQLNGQEKLLECFLDISERKQLEDRVRQQRDLLSNVIEATNVGTWRWNIQTGEVEFNERWAEIVGYTLSELAPLSIQTWLNLAHPEDLQESTARLQRHFAGELEHYNSECRMRHRDGSWVWVHDRGKVTEWSSDGKPRVMSGTHSDITARKEAEAELQETNRYLQEASARANAMAAEAEMANAAKSEFLANMSHEIRTPMNGVIGMAGLLLETELNENQQRYANIVRTSGEALLALLNDILDFSKIEAGKLSLETLDFDLRALLEDFAAMLALRAHDKGLEFICAAAPDMPILLRGDPGRLRQVLLNLTGNALKFTQKGEVAVRASLVSESGTEVVLRFSIKDTGIGIPADKQKILFQKFTQVDASTTRQYGGTGLGLAISKQLAEMMGGQIGLESSPGRGSEFWFTVRLGRQPEGTPPADSLPLADIRAAHVLVVDDNATNREVVRAQLATWGVRATEVRDGPAALQALRQAQTDGDPFRVAILDMQMPGMDGASLARAIKADEAVRETRLILMTSVGHREEAGKMEQIGFAAYLIKPMRQSELCSCLSTVLTDQSAARPARPILTAATSQETLNRFAGRKARILLAEDNITNQFVAVAVLKTMGLKADVVANGAEAVKALESLPYDAVLMDAQMPELDGYEATVQIRSPHSRALNPRVPIIAMTANAMQGDREKCLAAGMDDYVSKPVSPQALAVVLDKWLPKDAGAAAAWTEAPGQAVGSPAQRAVPVFDREGLMSRLMDDEVLALKVIECFLLDTPRQIAALRGYLESGDAGSARRQAHTLSGASANVGGDAVRAVALEMEAAAKAGDLGSVKARMAELQSQFEALREAMKKENLTPKPAA